MVNADELRHALSDKPTSDQSTRPGRQRAKSAHGREYRVSGKTKGPVASERSSELAQRWYDLGEAEGFSFPYNVNFFALALQRRIETDLEIQPFLKEGKHDQVQRWVLKMISLWWSPVDEDDQGGYITNEISQKNAKDYFLDNDWDDLRDYARSCLRAAYLKEHHRVAPKPIYPDQVAYRERLEEVGKEGKIKRWLRDTDEAPEHTPIDPEARKRLRSWVKTKKEERREGRQSDRPGNSPS